MTQPFDMRHVTIEHILATVDLQAARQVHEQTSCQSQPNSLSPWTGDVPPVGTWRLDDMMGEFEMLVELPLDQVEPGEPEDGIKGWEGYALYVQWAREGRQPPPITVVRHVDGRLVSIHRRRVLAAKDAGLRTILAWFSETDARGRNLWRLPEVRR